MFPETTVSLDALRSLQLERLRGALRHAYDNQAPYRAKCVAAGIHPDDLRRLEDLRRFPFTAKADLRDAYPFGMLAIPREKCVRIHASSGTTGRPTVVGYSARDIDLWADLMARSLYAGGARPGDIIHNAYGYGLFTGGLGAHYGAERLGCTVVPMSGGFGERQVQLIREFGARVVLMTPSYMLAIADEFERQGVDPRGTAMRIGIFGAEPWTEGMRAEIERRLGIDAVDIYGLSEVMGPGVACEFVESKDGPTIWEDHFYPEIVDPETGEPVPDGEPGELVFTTLTKEAMPVIRYRTRDLTRLLPGSVTRHAAHGQDHRPQRRHADRARREPVPEPGRGADPARPGAHRALRHRAHAHAARWTIFWCGSRRGRFWRARPPAARRMSWRGA